jgi:hypothetical protein
MRASTPADDEWIDVQAAARVTGWSEAAIRGRVARKQIPFRKIGEGRSARILFNRGELHDFIDKLRGCGVGEALANATRGGLR